MDESDLFEVREFFGVGLELAAIGVSGEFIEEVDCSADGEGVAVEFNFFGAVEDFAAASAEGLEAGNKDGVVGITNAIAQVMHDAAGGHHARGG